jgi:integrase
VRLTPAGELLLGHAEAIIARLEAARADLLALAEGESGTLRVGCYQSAGVRLLPRVVREFQAAWPRVRVELTEAEDDAHLLHLVERGELDLSFVVLPMMPGPFEHQELLEDPYVLVVRDDSPLGASGPVHPRDLTGIPLVTYARMRAVHAIENPAQILTLADRIDPRYRAMVLLAAGCGLRWSEAAGLTRDRIHLGARAQVTIDRQLGYRPATKRSSPDTASRPLFAPPKTSASCRVVPLPAAVTAALRAHLRTYPPGPAGLLFTTPAGDVLNPANWRQRVWRPMARSAPGIPASTTFHRLRHAYASLLGDAGLPDHEIQRRLGHAHPGEIRWYRHPYPDPGEGQATREAIDAALAAAKSDPGHAAAAC